MEGGLRNPERPPVPLDDPVYWDGAALDGEMRRQFDVCHGCRRCFNLCDSFPRLFDLIDGSRTLDLDSVDSAGFRDVVDACTLCDMCFMVSCPYVPPHEFAIDIPRLMLRARALDFRAGRVSWTDRQLAETERNGRLGALFAGLVNRLLRLRAARWAMERLAGVDRRARLPAYAGPWAGGRAEAPRGGPPPGGARRVVLYATCFVNYSAPAVGEAARAVLARNGVDVKAAHPGCCGMPQLEHGDVERVRDAARRTARAFRSDIEEGRTVVALTPSCALMLKSEWPALLPDDPDVRTLAAAARDIDEYVVGIADAEGLAPGLAPLAGGVTLHLACHSRAQNIGPKSLQMLRAIPDTEVTAVERCSGHGGTWGVKRRWFEVARRVGRPAARAVAKAESGHLAAACPLAGLHLSQLAGEAGDGPAPEARHPIELLAASYEAGTA